MNVPQCAYSDPADRRFLVSSLRLWRVVLLWTSLYVSFGGHWVPGFWNGTAESCLCLTWEENAKSLSSAFLLLYPCRQWESTMLHALTQCLVLYFSFAVCWVWSMVSVGFFFFLLLLLLFIASLFFNCCYIYRCIYTHTHTQTPKYINTTRSISIILLACIYF